MESLALSGAGQSSLINAINPSQGQQDPLANSVTRAAPAEGGQVAAINAPNEIYANIGIGGAIDTLA